MLNQITTGANISGLAIAILNTSMNVRTNAEKIRGIGRKVDENVSMLIMVVEDLLVGVQETFLHPKGGYKRSQL